MRRGMTLIELLVVIAVIAVLVGLTYTALLQARKRGYLTVCIGNLRQLTLAVHAYENDWGMVPIEYIHKTQKARMALFSKLFTHMSVTTTFSFAPRIIQKVKRYLCFRPYGKGKNGQ